MALELTEEQKKAGWQVLPLSQCFHIIGGGTPKTTISEYWNGNIPWLSVTDFVGDGRTVFETEKTITELGLEKSSTRLLDAGDLIVSARGTVGELARLSRPMAFNQSCYGLRGINGVITNEYGFYLMKTTINKLKQQSYGSVFSTITRSTFQNIEVSLPPLGEQKRIAEVLGSVDDKIEANSRLLDSLDELMRLEYQAMQSESELKISDIASEVKDGVSPTDILPDEVYVGLEHLPRRDVWLRDWGRGEEVTSNKSRFKKGDILFGKLRPYFHKVVVAPVDGICSTDIIVARPKSGFESLALQALSSDAVVAHATNASNGTRMPRAKWSDLKDLGVRGSANSKSVVSFDLVTALVAENRKLAETRDLLIRKLIKQ